MRPTGNNDASSSGDIPLPDKSTVDALLSLGLTLKFIYSWLK